LQLGDESEACAEGIAACRLALRQALPTGLASFCEQFSLASTSHCAADENASIADKNAALSYALVHSRAFCEQFSMASTSHSVADENASIADKNAALSYALVHSRAFCEQFSMASSSHSAADENASIADKNAALRYALDRNAALRYYIGWGSSLFWQKNAWSMQGATGLAFCESSFCWRSSYMCYHTDRSPCVLW
jgi:hypothetical protein